jgi:hypothetical protein
MRKQCNMVSTRLTKDVERFRVDWHERMRQVIEDFHKQQIEFLQQQSMDFSSALPALSSLDSGRSDLPTRPAAPVAKTEINMSYSTRGVKPIVGSIPMDSVESSPKATAAPVAAPPPPPPLSPERSKSFEEVQLVDSLPSDNSASEGDENLGAMGGEINLNQKSGAIMTSL